MTSVAALDLLDHGDVKDPESLKAAMSGVDMVVHIAALFREAKHPDSEYHAVNVQGTENVFDAAIDAGVSRIVHCSTVGVHSHIPDPPASEDEAYRPADIYQQTKCIGETRVNEYFESGKIEGVVIRPAMIWGPGDTRTFKLFKGISSRRMPLIGMGTTWLHWVHVKDLAKSFRLALEAKDVTNEAFIVCGKEPVTMKHLYETIADCCDVPSKFVRIPALPIQILGSLCELVCKPLGVEPPLYRRRVDFFTKTRSFDGSKAREMLGYEPAYTFREEVSEIVSWYKAKQWI